MSRFTQIPSVAANAPWSLGPQPTPTVTFEQGAGFEASDPHVALWNAAVNGLLADQFYETGDARVATLVELVPLCDPTWLAKFIPWLRDSAGLRSASVVLAAEYARAGFPNARSIVSLACLRADEPGEMLAYWYSRHSRSLPASVKRGVADACVRLYTERAVLRYDGTGKAWRFGDVLEVVHAKPSSDAQSELFKFVLDRRRHDPVASPLTLPRLSRTLMLDTTAPTERDLAKVLADSLVEFSWERASAWLGRPLGAADWAALIPNMGYMALLRNLNNFDRAGVHAGLVNTRLVDAEQVAKSRVMPFRFLTAYQNLEADTYRVALAQAADLALANLPEFPGCTLIMVDRSGSMQNAVGSGRSRSPLTLSHLAAFFAEALARRCAEAAVIAYNDDYAQVDILPHTSVLTGASRPEYTPRGGTSTWPITERVYGQLDGKPDRVVIITDEQDAFNDTGTIRCPVITWNLVGYDAHHAAHGSNNRYLVGGYSDTALQTLPAMISRGSTGRWPWDQAS